MINTGTVNAATNTEKLQHRKYFITFYYKKRQYFNTLKML